MHHEESERIRRAQRGDRAALERLLEDNEARIYRFALKLCRHPEDARGVLQETMIDAVRGIERFREDASLPTWLYTLARNRCLKRRRKSRFAPSEITPLHEEPPMASEVPTPDEQLESAELRRAVERAIARLDDEQREVLVLRDVEGASGAETAQILGISVAAMKSRLHRARKALREALEPVVTPPLDSCPDIVGLFSEKLEDTISTHDCRVMQDHLDGCAICRQTCQALESALAACHALPEPQVPEDIQRSVHEAILQTIRELR
ncbi:MAG: sigma-70 family RNA polymerase sigma factor [Polyangiaceae bacterium]